MQLLWLLIDNLYFDIDYVLFHQRDKPERKADRIKILNANQEDIRNLAIKIKEALASKNLCCIGSEGKINEDKELFAKVVNLFE